MIRATAQIELDVTAAVRETALVARPAMRREMSKVVNGPSVKTILAALSREPGKSHSPVRWTSEKQRRKVMALLRQQGKIPYPRSHDLSRGWRAVLLNLTEESGLIGIVNTVPYADFVQGNRIQTQHHLTGWPAAAPIIRAGAAAVQDETINAWGRVTTIR